MHMENTPVVDEVIVPKKNILFEVTPVSRVLAAILFIILPFVGFWIGYNFNTSYEQTTTSTIPEYQTSEAVSTSTEAQLATLVPIAKTPLKSSILPQKTNVESSYIPKHELDSLEIKDVRATENQNSTEEDIWLAETAGASLKEAAIINLLGTKSATHLGGGYYTIPTDNNIHWVGTRHVYGDSAYLVHAVIEKTFLKGASFEVVYTSEGSDLIIYGEDSVIVRDGETWSMVAELGFKEKLSFLNKTTDPDENTVLYFTDGKNLYGMYGNRPYEGCCTVMTENMFTVVGADLASFEIVDKSTAHDKNNVYTSTMSEKGGVELLISSR